jgi:hypothetical protein
MNSKNYFQLNHEIFRPNWIALLCTQINVKCQELGKIGIKKTNQNKPLQANGFTFITLSFRNFDCISFSFFFHHYDASCTRVTEPKISKFFTNQIAFTVGTFGQ